MSSRIQLDQGPETRQLESSEVVDPTSSVDVSPESAHAADDGYDLYDNMPCTD